MSKDKKDRRWDGKSRVSTDLYRRRFNEIFKKNQEDKKSSKDTSKKSAISTNIRLEAEIVNGTCPHCNLATVLVCLWHGNIYRCMTCGNDCKQYVNGKIAYLPVIHPPDGTKPYVRDW